MLPSSLDGYGYGGSDPGGVSGGECSLKRCQERDESSKVKEG